MTDFLLHGIDGANPLGFLTAIGALRTLAGSRLAWGITDGVWRPRLRAVDVATEDGLCAHLAELLQEEPPGAALLGANLTVPPEVFVGYMQSCEQLLAEDKPKAAEYAAAFGCEVCTDEKKNRIEYTSLCFITGSGHQDFVTTVRKLSECVTSQHMREALFGPWTYRDKSLSLRWDPSDASEYALKASDPSKDGAWTVWGANRLAFEALPLLPVQPTRQGLRTTGMREGRYPDTFTWPVWEAALGIDVVRSLLSFGELAAAVPDRVVLMSMGIGEVFRSPRVRIPPEGAKFKVSFRPAQAV